ncbi:MAG: hypothetical protein U5N55_10815 [Cypionkella sp.]|nr:hypothetical protein [Cypionkella sp.]
MAQISGQNFGRCATGANLWRKPLAQTPGNNDHGRTKKMPPKYNNRRNASDRLISQGATNAEIMADHACAPFDRVAREAEARWGIDRLPSLVSIETAAKFGSAMARLNAAMDGTDIEFTKAAVSICIRGIAAMEEEAIKSGHKPLDPEVWEYNYEGFKFAIHRDGEEWKAAQIKLPGVPFYTLREIAVILKSHQDAGGFVGASVKAAFPGAQIVEGQTTNGYRTRLG